MNAVLIVYTYLLIHLFTSHFCFYWHWQFCTYNLKLELFANLQKKTTVEQIAQLLFPPIALIQTLT